MFNCYFRPQGIPVNVIVRDVPAPTYICEVVTIEGGVAVSDFAVNHRFIEPLLEFRSVTPSERVANGTIIPVDGSQFLRPSLEDVQKVSSVLSMIDEKFSYESALDAYKKKVESENPNPAPEPTTEPALEK